MTINNIELMDIFKEFLDYAKNNFEYGKYKRNSLERDFQEFLLKKKE